VHEVIFAEYRYPFPQFSQTEKYLGFHDRVSEVAKVLASRASEAPPWEEKWPIERPEPPDDVPFPPLPRL
jgi:hypothetical protein